MEAQGSDTAADSRTSVKCHHGGEIFAFINTHGISQDNIVRKRYRSQGVLTYHQRGILVRSKALDRFESFASVILPWGGDQSLNILILFSQVFPAIVTARAVRSSPIPFHHGFH